MTLGGSITFRQIVGAMPLEGGDPPSKVETLPGRLRLIFTDGSQREVPFDETFLRIGEPVLK